MPPDEPWVSASDLAEYAYCPRSYWYSQHPERTGGVGVPGPRAREGTAFHRQTLSSEWHREQHPGLYLGLLLLGLASLAIAFYVGGLG